MDKICISSKKTLTSDGIKEASIVIEGSQIAYVGDSETANKYSPFEQSLTTEGYVLPGLINSHTHAAMILFNNLYTKIQGIEKSSGDSWLRRIWPIEDYLTPEEVYVCSMKAFTEMINTGTTCVADHYFFPKSIAMAARDAGVRLMVGQGILRNGSGSESDSFKFNTDIEQAVDDSLAARDGNLVEAMICAHSIYQLTRKDLEKIAKISQDNDMDVHIHLGEPRDYEILLKQNINSSCNTKCTTKREGINTTSVEYVRDAGLLNERLLAAHASILFDSDMELLKDSGARVAWCPFTKARKAQGLTRVPELLERKITVGLGTDGYISSYTYNILRQASHGITVINNTYGKKPGDMALQAQDVINMLTCDGAKTVGRTDIGSIEAGKKADLVFIKGESLDQIVHGSESTDVTDVMIDGKFVKRNSKVVSTDADEIDKRFKKIIKRFEAFIK